MMHYDYWGCNMSTVFQVIQQTASTSSSVNRTWQHYVALQVLNLCNDVGDIVLLVNTLDDAGNHLAGAEFVALRQALLQ